MHRTYSILSKNFPFIVILFFLFGWTTNEGIRYFDTATLDFAWDAEVDTISFFDSISQQTIYKVSDVQGQPHYYYQDVSTNVCFDNKCRPIRLKVYWNITGRYFGYALDGEEFLSRRDHDPFKEVDYQRLHLLLSDAFLPFGNVTFEELIEQSAGEAGQVDGVTGATSKQLATYVVEGAAYTTYVLWNVIYGPGREMIRSETSRELTPALLSKILSSPASADKIWGLNRIDGDQELNEELENSILTIISGDDYFASFSAVNVLSAHHLKSMSLQEGLFKIYRNADSNLRNQIFEKFKMVPALSPEVLKEVQTILPNLNGVHLGHWLELFDQFSIADDVTCEIVAGILEDKNSFVAKKAYEFLRDKPIENAVVMRALDQYKSRENR